MRIIQRISYVLLYQEFSKDESPKGVFVPGPEKREVRIRRISDSRQRTFHGDCCVIVSTMPFHRKDTTSWPQWSVMCQTVAAEAPTGDVFPAFFLASRGARSQLPLRA